MVNYNFMKNAKFIIVAVVLLVIGFFAGMEYKAYQVRSAFEKAFNTNEVASTEDKTVAEKAKEANMTVHIQKIGDELTLSSLTLKVNNVEETQTLSSDYSTPKTAKEGTKFVIVDLTVKNITNSAFTFFPNDGIIITDTQKREYKAYDNAIGSVKNYLNVRELSPSIVETGVVVYELPNDATSYSLVTSKAGSKDLYKIVLK